jgi:hypothetical protein
MNKHILSRRIASTNLFNKHGTCQKLQERKKERKKAEGASNYIEIQDLRSK